jgi:adenylosuccinate synthase
MPVSVVVGGQFGSEGKGKVSAFLARTRAASALVRVGGPNSGHTAVDAEGRTWSFRQIPAAVTQSKAPVVLPAGSLIDVGILLREVNDYGLPPHRLRIDGKASIVTDDHKRTEAGLVSQIGSTASGTGAALKERIARSPGHLRAFDVPELRPYIEADTSAFLRSLLKVNERIIVEGTQGFGLSLWQSDVYPFATSRDTTAAAFVAEAGLAPHDVDEVVLVLRTFPIRVGGNSGPLDDEISWDVLANEAGLPTGYHELTTATKRVRRVARFSHGIVRRAIACNAPHAIFLNHMDYVDPVYPVNGPSERSRSFVRYVERGIGQTVAFVGYGPDTTVARDALMGGFSD